MSSTAASAWPVAAASCLGFPTSIWHAFSQLVFFFSSCLKITLGITKDNSFLSHSPGLFDSLFDLSLSLSLYLFLCWAVCQSEPPAAEAELRRQKWSVCFQRVRDAGITRVRLQPAPWLNIIEWRTVFWLQFWRKMEDGLSFSLSFRLVNCLLKNPNKHQDCTVPVKRQTNLPSCGYDFCWAPPKHHYTIKLWLKKA